ncbi:putative ATP-dependent endonuclease of OLD family [Geothermobacter ehrlichii]|uniref:Putative ATP-dependent endonuclease of OLD family n=1 Tax=Geothermobacter ehrlichii TaxID=213224 RepID=A0A5D3WM42_9BACT|nr:AAA family ATPase [Geothermobacter ehrlichii]TYO99364.1 putative ATP-dependent endonuclease of OLD family [Geothermobacter ehrlichii]
MKLVEFRITNFRGLGGSGNVITFDGSNVIFLIGQNNVGKSSFLHAYEFFVNSRQKAAESDFFQYKTDTAIEMEADFRREEGDDENPDFSGEPDWIEKWVQTDTGLITIKKIWTEVGKAFTKYTKGADGEFVKNGFGGMDSLFTKYAPTPIAINAIETVESLEKKVNEIIEKEHLKKLKENYTTEYDDAVTAIRKIQEKVTSSEAIQTYNTNINASFKKVFPSLSLKISVKDEGGGIDVVKAFKTNHSIDVAKDGVDRKETFSQHGHGVIRQALFNFFAFLKSETIGNRKEYILLFEEPELFLHPKSTRLLREELYSLAEDSPFQILCCTHCPQMIDISKPHCSLVRICKVENERTVSHQVGESIFQNEVNKDFVQMINRFDPNVCEAFYADTVCLVEGDTEAVICRELLKSSYPSSDIFVLNTGSKNNIPFFQRILTHFRIRHVVIHDSDTRYAYVDRDRTKPRTKKDGNPRANSAWSLNASIQAELSAAKTQGVPVARLVSVYDFEGENDYVMDTDKGKPLSAYEFATTQKENADLPIRKFLEQIVGWNFEKEWSGEEVDAIEEPWKG